MITGFPVSHVAKSVSCVYTIKPHEISDGHFEWRHLVNKGDTDSLKSLKSTYLYFIVRSWSRQIQSDWWTVDLLTLFEFILFNGCNITRIYVTDTSHMKEVFTCEHASKGFFM